MRKTEFFKKMFRQSAAIALSCSMVLGMANVPSFDAFVKAQAESGIASSLSTTFEADSCNDDWLHTEGSNIVDKNGNVVRLTGANWFGFNCGERVLHGLWSADIRQAIKSCADRGINILRIPISTELLIEWKNGEAEKAGNFSNSPDWTFNPDLVNEDGTAMNTLQVMDKLMVLCKEYGVKVLIDCHSAKADNSGHVHPMWYNTEAGISTEDWIEGWKFIVDRYKNDDTFIAADLENEPHGKVDETEYAKWDNSTDINNWKYAAEECAKAILEINPNMLILVEGIEQNPKEGYTYDDPVQKTNEGYINFEGAWWGGNLRLVGDNPMELGNSDWNDQIMYSPHDYGPSVYNQTWFDKDFTEQTLLDDYWYDAWAYLVDENNEFNSPLLMGEWGGHMDKGKNEKWLNLLAEYMNKENISHTFWCLNPNSGDTGGLWDSSFSVWDEEKYAILEKTLWQTDSGTYIGLDHLVPLGDNGLTVNQYYGVSDTTWRPTSSTNAPASTTQQNNTTQAQVETTQKPADTTEAPVVTNDQPDNTETPVVTNDQPDNTEAPVVTNDQPDNTEAPVVTNDQPDNTSENPVVTTEQRPDNTSENPVVTTEQRPDNTSENPVVTTEQRPDNTSENPVATTEQRPNNTSETPVVTTEQRPNNTSENPVVTTEQRPNNTSENPVVTTEQNPNNTSENPVVTTEQRPNNTSENPVVTTEQNPNNTTQNSGVTTQQRPNNTSETPVATTEQNSNNTTQNPGGTTQGTTIPVESVSLNSIRESMHIGDTITLIPTVLPENATNQMVVWAVDNPNVVSVDRNGKVTAVSAGTAVVTVATNDGAKTASCAIIVEEEQPADIAVTGVTLTTNHLELTEGNKTQLQATVIPSNATNQELVWTSSDNSVAQVDNTGIVKALKAGTASIVVTSKATNSVYAICEVKVNAASDSSTGGNSNPGSTGTTTAVTSISLNTTKWYAKPGDTEQLTATIIPNNATNQTLNWSVDNSDVVSVDATGKMTAKKEGIAIVTATSVDGGKYDCCLVIVSEEKSQDVLVNGVSLSETSKTLEVGQQFTLTKTITPSNATNQNVIWASSDDTVATVSAYGQVTAVGKGTAIISVTTNDGAKTAWCAVTVTQKDSDNSNTGNSGISGSTDNNTGNSGTSGSNGNNNTGNAGTSGSNGNNNTGNAGTSGSNGNNNTGNNNTSANPAGSNTTQAPAGNSQSAAIAVTSVELLNDSLQLVTGQTSTIVPIILPSNATDQSVTFTSSDTSVLAVDANGTVKALKPGTAQVTVTSKNNISAVCQVVVKPAKVKGLKKSSVKKNRVTLSWKKVTGVTGYKLYKYDSKTKKYKLCKTTKSTKAIIKKLKKNTSYKFKVIAYVNTANKAITGTSSKAIKVKTKK